MMASNDGSVADARHLVAEFVSRPVDSCPTMRVVALTTHTSNLSAKMLR